MKILSVVGTRPQYIKAAAVSRALQGRHQEILVDTGQHYDFNMSDVFIRELGLPPPHYNLGVGSGSHAQQTGRMLLALEEVILEVKPDYVLVYGDTNSTLAGALAAAKLGVPLGHVEAGVRSYNRSLPEEINRVLTDHCAQALFCPTQESLRRLAAEGIDQGVHLVGDVMYDSLLQFLPQAEERSRILETVELRPRSYLLLTLHRPSNVDVLKRLAGLLAALGRLEERIVFPVHPRTRKSLEQLGWSPNSNLAFIDPVGYLDMLILEKNAHRIITDSGGVQKEAYIQGVPCITCRAETEWTETVEAGWNTLVGDDAERLLEAVSRPTPETPRPPVFGDGHAAERIARILA